MRDEYDFAKGVRGKYAKSLRTPSKPAIAIPDATPLAPQDWWELLRDVAETYDQHFLTAAEIQQGHVMSTANDLRAFADYILPVLEQIVLKK
jgi:hypothetical protein